VLMTVLVNAFVTVTVLVAVGGCVGDFVDDCVARW
jgi:hypothetical protein